MPIASEFKTEHHYVTGVVLTVIGLLGVAGSITGSLAAMLAGLFDPAILVPASGYKASTPTKTAPSNAANEGPGVGGTNQ